MKVEATWRGPGRLELLVSGIKPAEADELLASLDAAVTTDDEPLLAGRWTGHQWIYALSSPRPAPPGCCRLTTMRAFGTIRKRGNSYQIRWTENGRKVHEALPIGATKRDAEERLNGC